MRVEKKKKAYKKARRKYVQPYKALTILFAVIFVIMAPVSVMGEMFDNTFIIMENNKFWELENEDEDAILYENDFSSVEERIEYGSKIIEQVEAEGAALLMNENQTLPLGKGMKVSCFSTSSVNIVYGGTGSANVDASEALTLKDSLENSGFEVNDTLWDFYTTGAGSEYVRTSGSLFSETNATLAEVPWNEYGEDVIDSIVDYGDAAIVVLGRVGGEGSDLEFEEYNYLELCEEEKEMMAQIKAMKDAGTVKKIIVLVNTANALEMDFLLENEYGVDACLWIGDVGVSGINAVGKILNGDIQMEFLQEVVHLTP